MNNVSLIGNLGADPELRYTQSGTPVASMSIAVNKRWTNKDGEKQEKTDWFRVVAYGASAENHSKYLNKGSQIGVSGELRTDTWDDKDTGAKRSKTYVVANRVDYLSTSSSDSSQDSSAEGYPEDDAFEHTFNDEDIPF